MYGKPKQGSSRRFGRPLDELVPKSPSTPRTPRRDVEFYADPDMPFSTPFVYRRGVENITATRLNTAQQKKGMAAEKDEEEDLFGLGAFQDLFITKADLEKSRQKLAEEEWKTLEDQIKEGKNALVKWLSPTAIETEYASVQLIYNFLVLGTGALGFSENSLCWQGEFMGESGLKNLSFGFDELGDVRSKRVEGSIPLLLVTLDDRHFLQFGFIEDKKEEQAIVERIKQSIDKSESEESRLLKKAKIRYEQALNQAKQAYDDEVASIKARFRSLPIATGLQELCGICFTEPEQLLLEPCKHRICSGCWDRIEVVEESGKKLCPWDRIVVTEYNRDREND